MHLFFLIYSCPYLGFSSIKKPHKNAVPTHNILMSLLHFTFSFVPVLMDGDEHEENSKIPSNKQSIFKAELTLLNTDAGLEGWARRGCAPSPSAALSPVCHLLPAAHHTGVLLVGAVVRADVGVVTLQQCLLLPGALDIV